MAENIYDPLTEYANVFSKRFKEVAERTFDRLAQEAKVDVAANKATCRRIRKTQVLISSINRRIGSWKGIRILAWVVLLGAIGAAVAAYKDLQPLILVALGLSALLAVLVLTLVIGPRLKNLKKDRERLGGELAKTTEEAWAQMAPLNRLYDWDILTRMMTETVPRLEFDPYFTTERLADLQATYGWDSSFNNDRSVIYSHSGLINGNPFVICRTRKMEMGRKTYTGSKTIFWTTQERGSDGRYHSVQHSQVLTASVTAPFPEYFEKTRLIYGNTAAPDLVFHRRKSGLAGKERSWAYKKERRALRRKARNLEGADFAMMTNEEFEVAFNTGNRNDNRQFALLFTPLAQESMLKLLKDRKWGFGDDFNFHKMKMINAIVSDHMQGINLDMNPEVYKTFDFEKAKANFNTVNAQYFRAIYFCLAPLLCVPMYQQIRSQEDIYGHDMKRESAFWEHEALANFWGQNYFMHPDCVTDCILKTFREKDGGDDSTVTVYAHGYRAEQRVSWIDRFGGDGRVHKVPVCWDEYFPVTGTGRIRLKEDNIPEEDGCTQSQRLAHIRKVLDSAGFNLYRRHIASGII